MARSARALARDGVLPVVAATPVAAARPLATGSAVAVATPTAVTGPGRRRPGLVWPILLDAVLVVYLAFAVRGARNGVSEPSLTMVVTGVLAFANLVFAVRRRPSTTAAPAVRHWTRWGALGFCLASLGWVAGDQMSSTPLAAPRLALAAAAVAGAAVAIEVIGAVWAVGQHGRASADRAAAGTGQLRP